DRLIGCLLVTRGTVDFDCQKLHPRMQPGLTCQDKISSEMSMRSRQQSVLLLAACVLFFGRQLLAEQEVAFEIVASFDYPGALNTSPTGINESGDIVGSFLNKALQTQSFVRFADGTFSDPIVYPNAQSTYLSDINNNGTMCGSYVSGGT